MPSSSCLCKIHNEMFNVSDIISTKFCEYRHLADDEIIIGISALVAVKAE